MSINADTGGEYEWIRALWEMVVAILVIECDRER